MSNIKSLIKTLGEDRVKVNEPLSLHTTLKIGGPADVLFETVDSGELIKAVRLGMNFGVPVTVIGGGSNVLVSDLGIRGLVVKNRSKNIKIREGKINKISEILSNFVGSHFRGGGNKENLVSRWVGTDKGTKKYDFSDLNYSEDEFPDVEVVIDSGVNLQMALMHLINNGVTGLQWYGRIPGTIGGAVYNNIHGGSHVFAENVKSVVVLSPEGEVKTLSGKDLKFEYDKSRFHKTKETIVEIRLILKRGDADRARKTTEEWIKRKSIQPMNSAGCVFKNIEDGEREILGYPTTAVGYIVEHILNMSGFGVGGAYISPDHHNFIVNRGGATAKDYLAVRDAIHKKAGDVLGIALEDEIIRLGEFDY